MFKNTKTILSLTVLFFSLLTGQNSLAAKTIIGKADAPMGGTMTLALRSEPTTLNPITSTDGYSSEIEGYVMDGLLTKNIETFEWEPGIAEKYEMSKDGKTYTFYLRPDVTFHDGAPLTIEDVKFSYEVFKDNRYGASHMLPYYENIDKVEIVDAKTIRFHLKKKYFKDLDILGNTLLLQKKMYADPSKKMNKVLVGTGAYKLEKYDMGKSITLVRNKNWWGDKVDHLKGYAKPEKMLFKIVKEENAVLELFKKGELDFTLFSPEQYIKKTDGDMFGKTVFKKEVQNQMNRNTPFVAFNFKKKIFEDVRSRKALTHLFNRQFMIEKFFFNKHVLATGPWYRQNPYADPNVKPIEYNVSEAKSLLKAAGWLDEDKNGVLEKTIDGRKVEFKFTILIASAEWEKYLTVFQQDLKSAGIILNLKVLEWNAFNKKIDEQDFEAIGMAWGGVIEGDPKQIWHSESARTGGSNYISYNNKKVDELIDKGREEMDRANRTKIFRQVYKLVADDCPYIFLWNGNYFFYGHSKKMKMVQPTYKYAIGHGTWWIEAF
jgi:microcin C transport system substrate-binding protein